MVILGSIQQAADRKTVVSNVVATVRLSIIILQAPDPCT